MNIIYLLLTISVIVALIFLIAFLLSVKKGQYEDTYTPAVRILFEEEVVTQTENKQTTSTDKH